MKTFVQLGFSPPLPLPTRIQTADVVIFGVEPWYRWWKDPNLLMLRLIQIFTTDVWELIRGEVSQAVHVELVTWGGERLQDCRAIGARVGGVKERPLWASQNYVVVRWRGWTGPPTVSSSDPRLDVVTAAAAMLGTPYGYVRLLLHALDQLVSLWGLLPWRPFVHAWRGGEWEGRECANVVAYAYEYGAGVRFLDKPAHEVTPDDILDDVVLSTLAWNIIEAQGRLADSRTWLAIRLRALYGG